MATRLYASALFLALIAGSPSVSFAQYNAPGTEIQRTEPKEALVTHDELVAKTTIIALFAVQSGALAIDRSEDPRIRQFAQKMLADYRRIGHELEAAANGADMPDRVDAGRRQMMRDIQTASSDRFDGLYLSYQIDVHEAAVMLFREYQDQAADGPLLAFVEKTLPIMRGHLDMARALHDAS